jgi:hypothetical protein
MNEFKATNDKHRGMNEFKSIEKDRGEGYPPGIPKTGYLAVAVC